MNTIKRAAMAAVAVVVLGVAGLGIATQGGTVQAAPPPLRTICITMPSGQHYQLSTYDNFAADYLVLRLHVATEGPCP